MTVKHTHETRLDRRTALQAGGVAGLMGLGAGAYARPAWGLRAQDVGYDNQSGKYVLPPLPYGYDALEPHIDEQTMRIHHDRHHQGYVNKLNGAIEALAKFRAGEVDAGLIDHWSHELSFNGGGHINHTLFWLAMAPPDQGGGGEPTGTLAQAINRDFGSFEAFSNQFKAAAGSVKGSGWGWLCYEPISGQLVVTHMHNQESGLFGGLVALLGVDVWEHAYYLKYQNRRGDYLSAFMNVIHWAEIQRRFDAAVALF